jgi:hypothetical protein
MQIPGLRRDSLHDPALQLQEPDQDEDLRVVRALSQALSLAGRDFLRVNARVAGRHQHAELEPDLVLLGFLVVRVEQVALEQDRVSDLASVVEMLSLESHGCSDGSAASASSASTVASQVGRARRDLNCCSSSMAWLLILNHALFGK